MIFSSAEFLYVFLPIVWLGFMLLRCTAQRSDLLVLWLLSASFVFYARWEVSDLVLLLAVIAANFGAAKAGHRFRSRGFLIAICVANVAVLAVYKYLPWLFGGASNRVELLDSLPLGISFFIFQIIAFQVDRYRGTTFTYPLHRFALFVSFFPQLIAGPIVHGRRLLPQLRTLGQRAIPLSLGLSLLSIGLAKKVLLADTLAPGVDALFAQPVGSDAVHTIAAAVGYGTQLYCDFSGYADMAVGLGLLFGLRLPQNFRAPYRATSITDFWRRWHLTLSHFFRDYVYIPMGGNRRGAARRSFNVLATMLLCGVWHGAGWQFLIWGGLHGLLLILEGIWRRLRPVWMPESRWLCRLYSLSLIMMLWILFRSPTVETSTVLYSGLTDLKTTSWPTLWDLIQPVARLSTQDSPAIVVLLLSAQILGTLNLRPTAWRWCLKAGPLERGAVTAILLLMVGKAMTARPEQPFLYFQF